MGRPGNKNAPSRWRLGALVAGEGFEPSKAKPTDLQSAPIGRSGNLPGGVLAGRLARRLAVLTHPSLLVVDEIGYLPINHSGAVLFFQLMNRRYERVSTVLTSNKGFEEWGEILGDDVMAAALIDRVLHHCHLVNIRGNSYRMREHTELYRSLQSEVDAAEPPRRTRKSKASH